MNSIKRTLFCCLLLFSLSLCGCTEKEENQTFFIHGASFTQSGEGIKAQLLIERLSGDKSKYFTASIEAETLAEAAQKAKSRYRECYFATCRFYLINDKADGAFLTEFAKELCAGNNFPLTADVFCTYNCDGESIMKKIETGEDLTGFKSKTSGKSVNIIRFLADFSSGRDASVTSITISKEGKIKPDKKAVFKSGEGVMFENK